MNEEGSSPVGTDIDPETGNFVAPETLSPESIIDTQTSDAEPVSTEMNTAPPSENIPTEKLPENEVAKNPVDELKENLQLTFAKSLAVLLLDQSTEDHDNPYNLAHQLLNANPGSLDQIIQAATETITKAKKEDIASYKENVENFFSKYEASLVNIDKPTQELSAQEYAEQLRMRCDFLRLFEFNFGAQPDYYISQSIIASRTAPNFKEGEDNYNRAISDNSVQLSAQEVNELYKAKPKVSTVNKSDEPHLALGALIASPHISTAEFARGFSRALMSTEYRGFHDILSTRSTAQESETSLINAIQTGEYKPMTGSTIFEVGGQGASKQMETLGAKKLESADAGESGGAYGGGGIKFEDKVLSLASYEKYAAPHTADIVCSAQLFDLGSGIGFIADTRDPLDRDELGMREMTLVMANIVKNGGVLVNDGPIPQKLAEKIGLEKICSLNLVLKHDWISIYRLVDEPSIKSHKMGWKTANYNEETHTWEVSRAYKNKK